MLRLPRCRVALALASLTACAAPRHDPVPPTDGGTVRGGARQEAATTPPAELREAASALVDAGPERWAEACDAVERLASDIGPQVTGRALLEALGDRPQGAGVQPTLALLGNLDLPETRRALLDLATSGDPSAAHAADAALALGRGGADPAMIDRLRQVVESRTAPRTLRTCAAATLLDWDRPQLAAPFLHAVLVGGTPQGQDAMHRAGLVDDTRWALDRSIAIAAIDRWADEVAAYDLDPDLPWPTLRRRADRFLSDALEPGR